jgi:pimeloyl-ACP methyl ester carboxylesterase
MRPSGAAELRAALEGRGALEDYLASAAFDPEIFTPADHAALSGRWAWLAEVADQAIQVGWDGLVDDDLAYVAPWGFDPGQVTPPVVFLHGSEDRIAPRPHAEWLARQTPSWELWLRPEEGHISVLNSSPAAIDWLQERAR